MSAKKTTEEAARRPAGDDEQEPGAPRFGKGTVVLLGLLVGAVLSLCCALAYRYYLYNPHAPLLIYGFFVGKKPYFTVDPEFGWVPTANLDQEGSDPDRAGKHRFSSDGRGFRSPALAPGFAGRKVVLLGDSMIWGLGVDQQRIAGTLLQARLGAGQKVIVAASPGWSTDQQYLFFTRKVLPLKPHTVVWFVTASNDVIHNMTRQATSGVLYAKPRFELDAAGQLKLIPVDPDAPRIRMGESVKDQTSELNLFSKKADARFAAGLALTAAILKKGRQQWSRAGVKVHIVFFKPAIKTPRSTSYLGFAREIKADPADFSYAAALANIGRIVRLAQTRAYLFDNPAGTTFRTDDHLNEKGHVLLARFIEQLLAGKLTPTWPLTSPRTP